MKRLHLYSMLSNALGLFAFVFIIIGFIFVSCTALRDPGSQAQSADQPVLFADTKAVGILASQPYVVRSRFVKINIPVLLNEKGQPRNLDTRTEIALNLFPDTTYIYVLERMEQNAPDSYSWIGHLKGVKFSEVFIVFSEGVFIAHIASPVGVYEVQIADNDLYQIIEIDQSKLPQD